MSRSPQLEGPRQPSPPQARPRVWFISDGTSPVAIGLSRHLLSHGDRVVCVLNPWTRDEDEARCAELAALEGEAREQDWDLQVVSFDVRYARKPSTNSVAWAMLTRARSAD